MRFHVSFATLLSAVLFCSAASAQGGPHVEGLSVTTLGTGTPVFSLERSRPATLVSHGNVHILVDAGTGTELRLNQSGLNPRQISYLLFTHHHVDHNAEFPLFLVAGSISQNLESIVGPPGTTAYGRFLQDFYMEDMLYRTRRRNIDEKALRDISIRDLDGGESFDLAGLTITTTKVNHSIHTVAYRFDAGKDDSIVISGDLSYSDSLVELARGADILVIDSGGMPSATGETRDKRQGEASRGNGVNRPAGERPGRERAHASVEDVARMAAGAEVGTLVLTHIGYDQVDESQVRQRIAAIYGGRVEFASDGSRYPVPETSVQAVAPPPMTLQDGRSDIDGNGTVSDRTTGLTWQQSPDQDGNGIINAADKLTFEQASDAARRLELGGHSDWRLPTIKELYALIDFSGIDPGNYRGTDTAGLVPFIDTGTFDFAYGDAENDERLIDAQFASSTLYVSTTGPRDGETLFGVNFADGRIKGYGLKARGRDKTFYVLYVRGESTSSFNTFRNNGDGTITDDTSGLMWSREDSGKGLDWNEAKAWAGEMNAAKYLGYEDWRLPDAKELQGIVDYSRSPATTSSAAIDPLFHASEISNEAGQVDYPYYWTSTTHLNMSPQPDGAAVYIAFGRAMGYMDDAWVDAHGAGAQRSDPKAGDPDRFPQGRGPQGDAIRIYNYVRLVRDPG